jgi:hypothetical protein
MRNIQPETDQPPVVPPRTPIDRPMRASTATAQTVIPGTTTTSLDWWRLLRLVFVIQGLYYAITGLWPLLARVLPLPHLFSATSLGTNFEGTLIQALTAVLGLVLLATVTRPRPDGLLVGLGAGSSLAFFLTGWRFRSALGGRVFLDLVPEILLLVAMIVVYLAAIIHDRRRRG